VCPTRNSISRANGYSPDTFGEGIAAKEICLPRRFDLGDFVMKKFLLASVAMVAMISAASAADLAARTYTKAPMMPAAPSWTGFYIFGGAGGGIWDADSHGNVGGAPVTIDQRNGGDGWYGTVGLGYDWQVSNWVIGGFADGQFGSLRGSETVGTVLGRVKMQDAWAAGARLGYLVAPNVLSYVNAGYSGSHWSGTGLTDLNGTSLGVHTNSFNTNGFFVGGGVENNLNIFGISAPGWFMKTEYRAAYYDRKDLNINTDVTNVATGNSISFKPWVQTISTSLVYRFNWTGPMVTKY
jgi:outer membrane immunogenic protein